MTTRITGSTQLVYWGYFLSSKNGSPAQPLQYIAMHVVLKTVVQNPKWLLSSVAGDGLNTELDYFNYTKLHGLYAAVQKYDLQPLLPMRKPENGYNCKDVKQQKDDPRSLWKIINRLFPSSSQERHIYTQS